MDKGTYTGRRINFTGYAVTCFNPWLFTTHPPNMGCGVSALALLTGVPPSTIADHHPGPHFSDEFMLRFLRSRGFRMLRLTMCNLSTARSQIGAKHVLLVSQLCQQNEGTWLVFFDRTAYHNFDLYTLDPLSFLRKPVLSAYVLVHPRWRTRFPPSGPIAAARKPK